MTFTLLEIFLFILGMGCGVILTTIISYIVLKTI